MSTVLSGQFDLASAIEGSSLTAVDATNTNIATFTDSNTSDTPSAFTVSIDWGDGVTTGGNVVGSNGSFTVQADHTYADDDFFSPSVTITRTADSSQLVLFGGVNVTDTDNLVSQGTQVIPGSANVALTNVVVATFKNNTSNPPFINNAGDFFINIDWGDGNFTPGTVVLGGDKIYTVTGSHTYTADGQYSITAFMNDDSSSGDADVGVASAQADIGFGATQVLSSAAETIAIAAGTTVAKFSDNAGQPATSYNASIDWGDGTTTSGVVSGSGPSFTVTSPANHTYADEGLYTEVVTITRTTDSASITASGTVTVLENDVFDDAVGTTLTGSPGVSTGNVVLATFKDFGQFNNVPTGGNGSDFVATVDWGDGQTSAGTITGTNGNYTVSGSHTYAQNGTDIITVGIADDSTGQEDGQSTANITAQGTAFIGIAPVSGEDISGTEGTPIPAGTKVATFSDSNTGDQSTLFTATVDWGDGTTTAGTVAGSSGSFSVTAGPHTYADEDPEVVTTVVTNTADNTSITMLGHATLADADHLVLTADNISGSQGSPITAQVATFTDTYTANSASDFFATIAWGDGTTTVGTVSGSGGSFTVDGTHAYTDAGTDHFTVTVADDGFGTATASGTGTATIVARTVTGQMALTSATEGTALAGSTVVATFNDTDTSDMAGDFSATINWGDGQTTTGTVVGGNGSFSVEGGHTYADEGTEPASVTFTHTADNVSATASGNVTVGEGDVLTGHGTALKLKSQQPFTGVVATFSDTYTGNVPGDFSATISWGDGTTTTGTVSGGSGTFSVSGSHTYTHPGHENITVKLTDDAPGTATATANSTANVSATPKNDFNANFQSDLLLQENVNSAHPNVMLDVLNNAGTAVAASAIIANTKGWPVVAQGDFNNDNIGDVVLQNTGDGTPEIWLVNGTTVTSKVDLPSATSSWHIIAAADFNNDGSPDLLFQANNGQVGIWTMNGTSVVSMTGLANPGSSWHVIGAGDFNNDGNADILFQNNDGTPMIWEMNGTSIIAQATLFNPGSQWKEIGTGDFNGDGNADILFQQNSGQAGVWLMNGTTVTSMTGLGIPGPNYTAIGTSDFNGDGNADILFQNSNGTPLYWLMNGATITGTTTLANPGPQWQAQADGPFQTDDGGGPSSTPHLSTPDMAGTATLQQNLQQLPTGAGLHLT